MKVNTKYVPVILSTLGALASIGGLLVFLSWRLGLSKELSLALLSALLAGAAGFFAREIAPTIRRLQRSPRIFISSSQPEQAFAHQVSDALRRAGAKVWLAEENIRPGEDIVGAIDKAMGESDSFLVFVSGKPRGNVLLEIGMARAKGLRILPVVIGDAQVPSDLASIHYLKANGDEENIIKEVVEAVT